MEESVRPPHKQGYAVNYSTYMNHKCRCAGCTEDHRRKHQEYRQRAPKEVRKRMNKRKTERAKVQNDQNVAVNKAKPWSTTDVAIAMSPDLTAREAALMLGRTMFSVKQKRSQVRRAG